MTPDASTHSTPDEQPIELVHGLTRHTLDHSSITVYTFYNNRRQTIDTWADRVIETSKTWPQEDPYLILYDLRRTFLSPYFRQRAIEVNTVPRPQLKGAYAVVLPDSLVGHMIRLFIVRDIGQASHNTSSSVFNDYNIALEWLRERRDAFRAFSS